MQTEKKLLKNFSRYLPNVTDNETYIAIFFILIGIGIILLIDKYGTERKEFIDE